MKVELLYGKATIAAAVPPGCHEMVIRKQPRAPLRDPAIGHRRGLGPADRRALAGGLCAGQAQCLHLNLRLHAPGAKPPVPAPHD